MIVAPVAVPDPALPPPDPADRATWNARRLERLRWELENLNPGVKALADASYLNALDAQGSAVAAAASKAAAQASEANVAAMSNFKGTWASLAGALAKPASVFHNGAFWALLNNLADVATSQPGVTADWVVVGGSWPMLQVAVNTNAVPWRTYVITAGCTLTMPAITGSGIQIRVIVLAGVSGAALAPAGADKVRGVAGTMTFDNVPFDKILTDSGATYGWV
jgi:hypothetical protein